MRKNVFTLDGFAGAYIGYTDGSTWNGWAMPYFEKEEAMQVMQGFNECAQSPMQYDEIYDQFYLFDEDNMEIDIWTRQKFITDHGIKYLYGIGAGAWTWDEEFSKPIAEFVAELFADYDIEIDERLTTNKLKDFNKFKSVLITLRSDVDAETKISKIQEELQC